MFRLSVFVLLFPAWLLAEIPTHTTIASSANPWIFGEPFALTATVPYWVGSGVVTGRVDFYATNEAIGVPVWIGSAPVSTGGPTQGMARSRRPLFRPWWWIR